MKVHVDTDIIGASWSYFIGKKNWSKYKRDGEFWKHFLMHFRIYFFLRIINRVYWALTVVFWNRHVLSCMDYNKKCKEVFKCPPDIVWIIILVYVTFCALKFVTATKIKYSQSTKDCLLDSETFWYIAHFVSQGTLNKSTHLGSPVTSPSDIFTVFFFL